MDLDALNDPEMLHDTPLGDLEVRLTPAGWLGVCQVDDDHPERIAAFHDLASGDGTLLGAIYGRRHFERREVVALYERRKEAADASLEAERALVSRSMRQALDRFQRRHGDDARELLRRSLRGDRRSDG